MRVEATEHDDARGEYQCGDDHGDGDGLPFDAAVVQQRYAECVRVERERIERQPC